MKNQILLFLSLFISGILFAQSKNDVLLKVNGDEMKGKVTSVGEFDVKFVYAGETLEYTIKKSDILKITFASGRVEFFNRPALPSQQPESKDDPEQKKFTAGPVSPVEHHNKIAILPFGFIRDGQNAGEDMGYKAQSDAYAFIASHSAGYTVLEPRVTNALLIKAGATSDKIKGFTMTELCNILGVEYLVDGTITVNKGAQTSYTSGSYNASKSDDRNKASGSTFGSSTSMQTYRPSVLINVYTDKDANIYSKSHEALLSNSDGSYTSPLEYVLKRSPLYRK